MTELLHHTDFIPWLNTTFQILFEENVKLPAALTQVSLVNSYTPVDRKPFSLIFRTEQRNQYYPQAIYSVTHPEKGDISMFLVPLGFDGEGMRYEAIFS